MIYCSKGDCPNHHKESNPKCFENHKQFEYEFGKPVKRGERTDLSTIGK